MSLHFLLFDQDMYLTVNIWSLSINLSFNSVKEFEVVAVKFLCMCDADCGAV